MGNWRTGVFKSIQIPNKAVKVDRSVKILNPRGSKETDEEYGNRLLKLDFDFINRERQREVKVKPYIPETVFVPDEEYFIGEEDEIPMAARIQDFAGGKALKEINMTQLNEQQISILGELTAGAIRGYEETGEMLDIAGWQGERNKSLFKLLKLLIYPFKYSSNIIITIDGKVSLIDAKPVTARNNPANRLKRYLMYRRLKQIQRDYKC